MREQMQLRLKELTEERAAGARMLADLDARRAELQQTLLRIGGAVQVLEELLEEPGSAVEDGEEVSSPGAG